MNSSESSKEERRAHETKSNLKARSQECLCVSIPKNPASRGRADSIIGSWQLSVVENSKKAQDLRLETSLLCELAPIADPTLPADPSQAARGP